MRHAVAEARRPAAFPARGRWSSRVCGGSSMLLRRWPRRLGGTGFPEQLRAPCGVLARLAGLAARHQ
eukprot:9819194-Lingulodinium_polyedra.AAC.1